MRTFFAFKALSCSFVCSSKDSIEGIFGCTRTRTQVLLPLLLLQPNKAQTAYRLGRKAPLSLSSPESRFEVL